MEKSVDTERSILTMKNGRSQAMIWVSFVVVVAMLGVLSFASVGFDIEQLGTRKYFTNCAILLFIAIYGLLAGGKLGEINTQGNPKGAFQFARLAFLDILDKLDTLRLNIFFDEYVQIFFAKKRLRKQENLLASVNVRQTEVLKLSRDEVMNLVNVPIKKQWDDGKETIFMRISPEQRDVILTIIDGKLECATLDASFYINELNNGETDDDDKARRAEQYKKKTRMYNYLYKIGTMLIATAIIGGFVVNAFTGGSTLQAVLDMVTRLFNLVVSIAWAYFTAHELNKVDVFVFNYKRKFINKYIEAYQSRVYVPVDVEMKAKEEYERLTVAKPDPTTNSTQQ